MLYFVRLNYGFLIKAASREEAFAKAMEGIKASPSSAIRTVEDASLARDIPLWKRFVTGR